MEIYESNLRSPISAYSKYRSQSKTNALLNKLHNDSGYPQDFLREDNPMRTTNYLADNKKNLKNFYADRIKKEQSKIYRQSQTIDPARILQIRKQQYELKSKTKMLLGTAMRNGIITSKEQSRIRKINQIFAINDKNREFKKNFCDIKPKSYTMYESDNHRRGTSSFIQKKSTITKKEAYERVFGLDVSSISRTETVERHKRSEARSKHMHLYTIKPVYSDEKPQYSKQFRRLITKMKGNYQEFNTNGSAKLNQIQVNDSPTREEEGRSSQIIGWIKNFSETCQRTLKGDDRTQLQSLQDISKLDSVYYQKMNEHKKKRLNTRMLLVDSNILDLNFYKITHTPIAEHMGNAVDLSVTDINQELPEQVPQQQNESDNLLTQKMTMREKFIWLNEQLTQILLKSKIFNIRKQCLYDAFFSRSQPFEKQGSYTFFKAIKLGKIDPIQSFLNQDLSYLYGKNDKGRSPLMVAIRYEHADLAKFFLELGSNLDYQCFANKTALYYAVFNRNVLLCKMLLQNGASPWSTPECNFKKMEPQMSQQMRLLFSNARRLRVAYQLAKVRLKPRVWNNNKHKINQYEAINFLCD